MAADNPPLPADFRTRVPPPDSGYWAIVAARARDLESDGCSGVPDFYLDACLEHDTHYRTGRWLDGTPITRAEADARLRAVIQSRSPLGPISPMAWWRWAAVRLLGGGSWRGDTG